MQLKKWLTGAVLVVLLDLVTPFILTTAVTVGVTIANPTLALIGGTGLLLGAAGLATVKKAKVLTPKFHHRFVRQAIQLPDESFSTSALEALFAVAESLDQETNCGQRLVCELAATPEAQLAPDEDLLISFIEDQSSLNHNQLNSPATTFQRAFFLGRQTGSVEDCANTYQKCPFSSNQTMEIIRSVGPAASTQV
ncbi:uncharacterized protein LOC121860644 [Homarus americanus]|uniref:Uncharacterized protein n=1 Tax=Homarus americanus TaxID=6706 RepID=A0A8J5N4L3_HOMAM|nr:uncharacterized protein LOC121860644 [Homarus americanus]KAG7173353.1 hypothetical protein Hamer_G018631 [Homarus americanus]